MSEVIRLNIYSEYVLPAVKNFEYCCDERAGLSIFRPEEKYSERLMMYLEYDKYYGKYEFARLTSGIGTCQTFRKCLRKYIKNFKTQELSIFHGSKIKVSENGMFRIDGNQDYLQLISYLNIIAFWDEFELIRDYSYIKRPIIFTELDEEFAKLLEETDCEVLEGRKVFSVEELR